MLERIILEQIDFFIPIWQTIGWFLLGVLIGRILTLLEQDKNKLI